MGTAAVISRVFFEVPLPVTVTPGDVPTDVRISATSAGSWG